MKQQTVPNQTQCLSANPRAGAARSRAVCPKTCCFALLCALYLCCADPVRAGDLRTLKELSIDELMQLEVSILGSTPKPVVETPAALFVITPSQIQRSGAQSIPELLRRVPGLAVARIDANKWAISARGFDNQLANKLLVMIDGRSVYTPLFSGTFWDVQDVMLEDVERIEVIRGPGAAVWGANAVNGVINIITKNSSETQGSLLSATLGNEQSRVAIRHGGTLGGQAHYRGYAKYRYQDDSQLAGGGDSADEWQEMRGGFRMDWRRNGDQLQLQGDAYRGNLGERLEVVHGGAPDFSELRNDSIDVSGGNLLFRWSQNPEAGSRHHFQAYLDHSRRDQSIVEETRTTLDLSWQQHAALRSGAGLTWGLGYRISRDRLPDGNPAQGELRFLHPTSRTDQLFSGFVQYDHPFPGQRFWLTPGLKVEHNDYTGFEMQPGIRTRYQLNDHSLVWASLSRAMRVPSRAEHDAVFGLQVIDAGPPPTIATVVGNPDFDAEQLVAWELGYRSAPSDQLMYDIALFYNEYDHLQTLEPAGLGTLPTPFPSVAALITPDNQLHGETYGLEIAARWGITPKLAVIGTYSYLEMALHASASTLDPRPEINEEFSPEQQLSLELEYLVRPNLTLSLWSHYRDQLSRLDTGDYVLLNATLNWRVTDHTEMVIGAHNLLNNSQKQFESGVDPSEVERSFFVQVRHHFGE